MVETATGTFIQIQISNIIIVQQNSSTIVIEVIRTVFIITFFLRKHFKHLKRKQKHLK